MAKQSTKQARKTPKSSGGCGANRKSAPNGLKCAQQQGFVSNNFKLIIGFFIVGLACSLFVLTMKTNNYYNTAKDKIKENKEASAPRPKAKKKVRNPPKAEKEKAKDTLTPELFKDFKPNILKQFNVKSLNTGGTAINAKALAHSYRGSSVRAYILENFLSPYECDSLAAVHDNHVKETTKLDPLLCFDSLKTLKQNIKEVGVKNIKVNDNDFIQGTLCINESLSTLLRKHGMKWSYSTSFYAGESQFSLTLAQRIKAATGLSPENGGKFQITSYPQNVGYKNHTDCVEGQAEKRDRFATILVYLKDVPEGGQTMFPKLGISVTPKQGLALVWNSMTATGECDPSSLHNAAKVVQGHKYILQRWYYYQNFPSLGKRFQEPALPPRKENQPRVTCDQYEFGSCRWYDEWNYDHITQYLQNQHTYV